MAQSLTQIKSLLAEYGLRPRRAWGQNFLHDHNKLRAILDAADPAPGRTVLEVGPGTGTLTGELLDAGAHVIAVEIDPGLCRILRDLFGEDSPRWRLIQGDVLAGKHALHPAVAAALASGPADRPAAVPSDRRPVGHPAVIGDNPVMPPFQLIANLPYQVAGSLLVNLTADYPAMSAAIVMVQREVAGRITATAGREYGPLSILLQVICHIDTITTLPPGCFWPAPKIESAVIRLTRRPCPLTDDPHGLADFCRRLFSRRRKQVGTILGRDVAWPPGIDPTDRPEQLDVEQILTLMKAVAPSTEKTDPPSR